MRKMVIILLICTLVLGMMPGCANIQNDHTRTTTEATIFGGVALAATGALVGGALGGKRGAWIAGVTALFLGVAMGYFAGKHIADKKKDYADEEAWLDASLKQAEQNNAALKKYNKDLADTATALDKKTKQLQADYAANKVDRQQLIDERNNIEKAVKENNQVIDNAQKEIEGQQKVLADAKSNNMTQASALLEAEIISLQRQKAQLEKTNKQLAGMSARISV